MREGASRLVRLRGDERYRIVVLLDLPTLWQSELLVFESNARLKAFMERASPDQTWTPLPLDDVFQQKLVISADVEAHRFHDRIQDENDIYTGEVWLLVQSAGNFLRRSSKKKRSLHRSQAESSP
ncbi:DUF3916 domain-containing protein [Exiguobacterium sp. SH5S4]|nr:DUF3916 domain-containing protein [Exiguobacterium sp. SH5S4]